MSSDVLTSALTLVSDLDDLDQVGMRAFNKSFKENIPQPTTISSKIEQGAMALSAAACGYIFWTIFFISATIIIGLAYLELISWGTALIIIVICGAVVLLMASLLYNRVNDFIGKAKAELNDHIADYTKSATSDFITAFKSGIISYARARKKVDAHTMSDPSEDGELDL